MVLISSKRRFKDILKTSYVPIYNLYEVSYRHPIFYPILYFRLFLRRLIDIFWTSYFFILRYFLNVVFWTSYFFHLWRF